MSVADAMSQQQRLAAPRQDGGLLVSPPWLDLPARLAANIAARRRATLDIQGRDLLSLSQQARAQLISDATAFTRQYRDVPPSRVPDAPLILAGHQPQLFHPGVWCKNFALGLLAQQQQAVAVNLLIDSDEVRSTSSRIPGGTLTQPTLASIPFDAPPEPGLPYEECAIRDLPLLESFGARAAETIGPLISSPTVTDYWPLVVERARATGNLGLALAQSRHQLEGQWGVATLELPQSHCCRGEPFAYFVTHLLAHLPRLWEVYNSSLAEYRHAQRIRSAAHPVPDLAMEHDWLEAPLWVWTADDPRRRPLFVRCSGDQLQLSDRVGGHWVLDATADSDAERAAAQLADYASSGLRLRTRALSTTMYARLMLSDLFIHGIGGSKYDELTDLLIERFFGLTPPTYATLSATLRLPVARPEIDINSLGQLDHKIRELAYHPEVYVNSRVNPNGTDNTNGDPWPLIERKRHWLATAMTPENAAVRHRELSEINHSLWPWVADEASRLSGQREQLGQALRTASILASREYDFCLYPVDFLRHFLCEALPQKLAS
ncbi:MAG: hypothetical protein K8T91_19940 [Planctomycetes bacterium]|nr:hypothetical protein [Planctomycetota bacterium]